MKKKKKKQSILLLLSFILIGVFCGFFMAMYLDKNTTDGMSKGEELLQVAFLFAGMYVAMMIQIVIHEAGHLIFGLLTGYRFSSFRIGSLMLQKTKEGYRFRKFSLAGTGGQCLMQPPELKDGTIPFMLYNFGGSILNFISAILFFGLYRLTKSIPFLSNFFLFLVIIGVGYAMINGIPMHAEGVDNDGYNAISLRKSKEAVYSFWLQMKMNQNLSEDIPLRDMPAEWFEMPSEEGMHNSMIAARAVFACNRLMDEKKMAEADALMEQLLNMDSAIVDLHRKLLICDRIYCELIGQKRKEKIEALYDAEQKKFMKTMKRFPSVVRTEYAYALLVEQNQEQAEKIKKEFEKIAVTYPYKQDIQSERELMEMAAESKS